MITEREVVALVASGVNNDELAEIHSRRAVSPAAALATVFTLVESAHGRRPTIT
ncbi:hypothetical protein [Catellatospora sp. NPDC049133]|uniref:hypothetical protein n=1 Tax=Catellatospora sp. NPDC049133 TaxID=3155499 RepID=UPI00340690B8